MGGAERSKRQRQQDANKNKAAAAKAVAAARGANKDRRNIIIGVVGILVVAAIVIVAVTLKSKEVDKNKLEAIGVAKAASEYQATVGDDGVITAGKPDAKVKVDVWEDFICPACGEFEKRDNAQIDKALAEGKLQVRYHIVNMLDRSSVPAGYSTLAGNATLAAAKAGKFADYHSSLFNSQPREGSEGYTADQLINLGQRIGITGDQFANDVRNSTYTSKVTANYDAVKEQPWYKGTPTVRSGDTSIDVLKDGQWLDKLLNGAANS
ncbi:thioredoxin domain-containing protein [Kutzneria viridogrisea]|uniref:Protein-disulfide isomerase n=2 Tax=Kutzneria TaxID=43356 RepID=A0ABR6BU85_9PSEU|nr:thioredoxin domain-containing protein [Kutzneria albida]AHH94518.1 putative membrane protein [Kutzneria albida DSM 43870]MBA8930186.1 protein-disulfide isomerase [Kutzneria viridogrisea]